MEIKRTYEIEQLHGEMKKDDWDNYDTKKWVAVDDIIKFLQEDMSNEKDDLTNYELAENEVRKDIIKLLENQKQGEEDDE